MKIRGLKKHLPENNYLIANHVKYLGVGTVLCHDLLRLDIQTLKIKIALDTWNKGRDYLAKKNDSLLKIYDKLQEMISDGSIHEYLTGQDEIEKPIKLYYIKDGKIKSTTTDNFDMENITAEGFLICNYSFFQTQKEAIEYGINSYKNRIKTLSEIAQEKQEFLNETNSKINSSKQYLANLQKLIQDV